MTCCLIGMERRLEDFLFKLEERLWVETADYLQRNLADAAIMVFPDPAGVLIKDEINVETWRTDVVAQIIDELGLEAVMFEAADPAVFEWYVKNYGAEVNLFVDHSQIVQLECLRAGIWGTKSTWGRITTFKP